MNNRQSKIGDGKSAAVLAPGPWLAAVTAEELAGYDLVIGVNRAVAVARCDWWVNLDGHLFWTIVRDEKAFEDVPDVLKPIFICSRGTWYPINLKPESNGFRWMDSRTVEGTIPRRPVRWAKFSFTTAIVLAAHLGARRIDCYGATWSGVADFDGYTSGKNQRTDSRWERERKVYEELREMLAGRGVAVRRMMNEPVNQLTS